jgi:hypothetical protein
MATGDDRCILVLDDELPRWLAANATAVLGVALGGHGRIPLGPDLPDGSGDLHPGIGTVPLPILTAPAHELPALRRKALELGIFVVDFNGAAYQSKTYDQYQDLLGATELSYLGLGMHGSAKPLRSLTGNLRSLK